MRCGDTREDETFHFGSPEIEHEVECKRAFLGREPESPREKHPCSYPDDVSPVDAAPPKIDSIGIARVLEEIVRLVRQPQRCNY
jgi:hypothetical protein